MSSPGKNVGLGVALTAASLAGLIRLHWHSWRRTEEGIERIEALAAAGRRPLVVFWHGEYPGIFPFFQGKRACVFASRSFRGEVIGEICRHFGYRAVLLPEHAGHQALSLMRDALVEHPASALALDGPRGPRHQVRKGALRLASELGLPLVPVSVSASHAVTMKKRWDRLEVPALFSRVALAAGSALEVPRGMGEEDLRAWAERLKVALMCAGARADELAGARREKGERGRE